VDPVIEARGLSFSYPDGTRGVRAVDLDVAAGERVAVVGANGSGKSTLALSLGGLLDAEGTVTYFGETTDADAVRERLGVLLGNPDDCLFNTTVREDLAYGPAQFGMPEAEADDRIAELAETLGLTELLDKPPFRLSAGEKRRAALASVLAFDPDVLLLDEPLGAVDGSYRERILDLLREYEGTVVTFTPTVEAVPRLAERVVVMSEGETVADGRLREVLTDSELLASAGLRPPPAVRLFDGKIPREELPLTVAAARERL